MLFNSFAFFIVFLPLALTGYFVLGKHSTKAAITFLLVASIGFYGYWNPADLPLLLASIVANYWCGGVITRSKLAGDDAAAKTALRVGLVFNLSLLVFFKYFDFLLSNVGGLTGLPLKPLAIELPIGISFFTFTQIAYLVDCHAGKVREYRAESYGLFVTYFPHLIAGPILHHKEMMPQFNRAESHVFSSGRLTLGMAIFGIGLFKKVVLADGVAQFVAPVFDLHHAELTMAEAWTGAFAYTFQLYFDFSAYCDMAYGLSYMLGIILPINFNSPYKAASIIDFWRRWHITLSTFLRDYLYLPLGGNRRGSARRYINLLLTMLLGGLWHGANWTFIVWGALHGGYLIVNHALRRLFGERQHAGLQLIGWALTFLSVVMAWVFFRASSVEVALEILEGMWRGTYALSFDPSAGRSRIMNLDAAWVWIAACALLAFLAPNIYDLIGNRARPDLEARLASRLGGVLLGASLVIVLVLLTVSQTRGVSEFLYFNF